MRTIATILLLLALLVSSVASNVLADELDRKPDITPHQAEVVPGDTFDLEVTVQAWANSTYTVTFEERTRFSFPGVKSQSQAMIKSDAIRFEVPCTVDGDAPDGDFMVDFNVTWEDNGTAHALTSQVRVIVGEGAGTGDDACTTSVMVASAALLAFPLLIVGRRKDDRTRR